MVYEYVLNISYCIYNIGMDKHYAEKYYYQSCLFFSSCVQDPIQLFFFGNWEITTVYKRKTHF